jgi:hypothetical protein
MSQRRGLWVYLSHGLYEFQVKCWVGQRIICLIHISVFRGINLPVYLVKLYSTTYSTHTHTPTNAHHNLGRYRTCCISCIYSSICGMVLSTMYFLFKRNKPGAFILTSHELVTLSSPSRFIILSLLYPKHQFCLSFCLLIFSEHWKVWKRKARWLVIALFCCSGAAVVSVMILSSLIFDWFFVNSDNMICNYNGAPYVLPGIVVVGFAFLVGVLLIF